MVKFKTGSFLIREYVLNIMARYMDARVRFKWKRADFLFIPCQ